MRRRSPSSSRASCCSAKCGRPSRISRRTSRESRRRARPRTNYRAMAAQPKPVEAKPRPIIVVKKKIQAAGHHGGAWKVAYADFVTAMMAFFLVMWLVTAVSKEQRAAIFDYFKNPSMEPGKSVKPAPGQMGPGGASTAAINLGGGLDSPKTSLKKTDRIGATVMTSPAPPIDLKTEEQKAAEAAELAKLLEKKRLDALMQ